MTKSRKKSADSNRNREGAVSLKINYMAEINAFYDWQEANPLTSSSVNLWHALMNIANKSGWPENLTVAMSTLRSHTRYGKDAIYAARNVLKQRGRIDFKERDGRQSAVYRIIPFVSNIQTQNNSASDYQTQQPTQQPTQVPTQVPTQQPNITRLDYTIPDRSFFSDDDDDGAGVRENAEKGKVESFVENLFKKYFGRLPVAGEIEICKALLSVKDFELVDESFCEAMTNGQFNLAYVRGILARKTQRGIRTVDDSAAYDLTRLQCGSRR